MDDGQPQLTRKGTPLTNFVLRLSPEEAATQGDRWLVLRDSTRLQIIDILNRYDKLLCVSEIAALLDKSPSAISGHLKKLREAGIVESEAYQTCRYYRIKPNAFDGYWDYLEGFIEA